MVSRDGGAHASGLARKAIRWRWQAAGGPCRESVVVDIRSCPRLAFALQLVTVRWLGTFLEDPLGVPGDVLDFMAGQLDMADPSQVKRYTERAKTPRSNL